MYPLSVALSWYGLRQLLHLLCNFELVLFVCRLVLRIHEIRLVQVLGIESLVYISDTQKREERLHDFVIREVEAHC